MAKKLAGVPILSLALFLLGGCAVSTQVTNTPRSSIEQQLLMRSLERALTAPVERAIRAGIPVTVFDSVDHCLRIRGCARASR